MTNNQILAAAFNIAMDYNLDLALRLRVDANYTGGKVVQKLTMTGMKAVPGEQESSKNAVDSLGDMVGTLRSMIEEKKNMVVEVSGRHHQYLLALFNVRCAEYAEVEVKEMAVYQS